MQDFLSWVFILDQNLYTENFVKINASGMFLKSVLAVAKYLAQMWFHK